MYWFGLGWLETSHFFFTNECRQIHSPFCSLRRVFTEKDAWAYPTKKALKPTVLLMEGQVFIMLSLIKG